MIEYAGTSVEVLSANTNRLLHTYLSNSILGTPTLSDYVDSCIEKQLAATYTVLDQQTSYFFSAQFECELQFHTYDHIKLVATTIKEIIDVTKHIDDLVYGLYLYGSLATLDYRLGWSDVDLLLVVDKGRLNKPLNIAKLRLVNTIYNELSKKIDPLQHHGVRIVTFDQLMTGWIGLPLESLKGLCCLYGEPKFPITPPVTPKANKTVISNIFKLFDETNKTQVLKHHAYKGEYLLNEYQNADNGMYQFKYMTGLMLLLPALVLQGRGHPTHKKAAIESAASFLPTDLVYVIRQFELVRYEWSLREGASYKPNKIPGWVREYIPDDYFGMIVSALYELKKAELGG